MLLMVISSLVIFFISYLFITTRKPSKYPPGPNWLPLVGSMFLFKKLSKELKGQHHAFNLLSEQYNTNVLGIKLANNLVVFVSSFPLIKQVLTNDEFISRPDTFFIRLRSMGTKKGITGTDGELWSTHRNFLVRHLRDLGFGKQTMDIMIKEELLEILEILNSNREGCQMGKILAPAVLNVLWALTAGERISRKNPRLNGLLELMGIRSKVFDISGGVLSHFPWLRYIFPEKTGYNLILRLNKQLKDFFMEIIEEHFRDWTEGRCDDVIYSFITKMNEGDDPTFTHDQLVMICLDIFIAGAQTTSNTIDFAIQMMILYPEVQKKVQTCLDANFPGNKLPEYNERHLVPYVEAVICEIMRYCHVTPITGPRRTLCDTEIDGYLIPKNTTILINNFKLNNDPKIWVDPENFRPERFLNEDGLLELKEEFIPFNIGKRKCLGDALARNCIFTFFTGIVKTYNITLQYGTPMPKGQPIPGITLTPESYIASFSKRNM